jgi:hypothetical protein
MASYDPTTGALQRDDAHKVIRASFTRPANTTAYAAGDVVNGDGVLVPVTLTAVAKRNGGGGVIESVGLETNNVTVTNGTFRVHFFSASHATAADNAAFASLHANRAAYIGFADLTILVADSASATGAQTQADVNIPFQCASADDDLYAVVVATGAYTPASGQVFQLTVTVRRD